MVKTEENPLMDKLIYNLIFSEQTDYEIYVNKYLDDINNFKFFLKEIKDILKKSKVEISKSIIMFDTDIIIWNLKLNK